MQTVYTMGREFGGHCEVLQLTGVDCFYYPEVEPGSMYFHQTPFLSASTS